MIKNLLRGKSAFFGRSFSKCLYNINLLQFSTKMERRIFIPYEKDEDFELVLQVIFNNHIIQVKE